MTRPRYSIIPPQAFLELRGLPLAVLGVLGSHTNHEGWCRINQGKLAERIGCSREAVCRAVRSLVEAGFVETRDLRAKGQPTLLYRVIMDRPCDEEALNTVEEVDISGGVSAPKAFDKPDENGGEDLVISTSQGMKTSHPCDAQITRLVTPASHPCDVWDHNRNDLTNSKPESVTRETAEKASPQKCSRPSGERDGRTDETNGRGAGAPKRRPEKLGLFADAPRVSPAPACDAEAEAFAALKAAMAPAWSADTTLTPSRRRAIAQVIAREGAERWAKMLAMLPASGLAKGEGRDGWVISFDGVMDAERFAKIVEGAYVPRAQREAAAKAAALAATRASLTPEHIRRIFLRWAGDGGLLACWPEAMGPEPGAPGCIAPDELIAEVGFAGHRLSDRDRDRARARWAAEFGGRDFLFWPKMDWGPAPGTLDTRLSDAAADEFGLPRRKELPPKMTPERLGALMADFRARHAALASGAASAAGRAAFAA
ncbi:MAG: helix-turn-helix domain-containing protein [Hyphomicrobiales bacterium]|nr:helix-turn-helix domain-containing protein [Hyphomicrobiales bacterium]